MPVTLYVDGDRWRRHLSDVAADTPGLIPVAKGNGYGFTVGRLARRAEWLKADMLAVGTYQEVATVRDRFSGDILVMEPWRPFLPDLVYDGRLVHTVGRAQDLAALGDRSDRPRVVLEGLTSMRRFGFVRRGLAEAAALASRVRVEGHALHLPIRPRSDDDQLAEVERWLAEAPTPRWFVSHLTGSQLAKLAAAHPKVELRPRVGTALWLGAPEALVARATVLDVHEVRRGMRLGYRQRPIARAGRVVVVSGGTAHGIGLEAPAAAGSMRQRGVEFAKGGLGAAGRALSPYRIDGRYRWFVEPPHMQVSLVFVPLGAQPPAVGDEVEVRVRHTIAHFDEMRIS